MDAKSILGIWRSNSNDSRCWASSPSWFANETATRWEMAEPAAIAGGIRSHAPGAVDRSRDHPPQADGSVLRRDGGADHPRGTGASSSFGRYPRGREVSGRVQDHEAGLLQSVSQGSRSRAFA